MGLITTANDERLASIEHDNTVKVYHYDDIGSPAKAAYESKSSDVSILLDSLRAASLTAERDALREENRELLYEVNESRRASMAPPADVVWCDENGKEYRLVWDSGDESVGIHGGWVCEELDGLVERLALADKMAEAMILSLEAIRSGIGTHGEPCHSPSKCGFLREADIAFKAGEAALSAFRKG